jgi:ribonuclease Z
LGSGAAIPTLYRNPSAQLINCNERFILIDCAEGTQAQLRKCSIKFQKIQVILISHLHGDHFFGLPGLLSSFNLLGRTQKLIIFGPVGLESLIRPLLEAGDHKLSFEVVFNEIHFPFVGQLFEDKILRIKTFPLRHRIHTQGFVIEEKEKPRTLNKVYFDELGLSISCIPLIKAGEDVCLPNGDIVPNAALSFSPPAPKSYAYCSDTAYDEAIAAQVHGCDLLYHEATFANNLAKRAQKTFHSTAIQAATIAQKADAKRLLLGHFSSRYKSVDVLLAEAQSIFPETICVKDGDVYRI